MYYAQAVKKLGINPDEILPHFEALAAQFPESGIRLFSHGKSVDLGTEFSIIWIKVGRASRNPFHIRTIDEARELYADLRTCLRRGLTGRELALTMCRIGARRP